MSPRRTVRRPHWRRLAPGTQVGLAFMAAGGLLIVLALVVFLTV